MTNSLSLKLVPLGFLLALGCDKASELGTVPNPPSGYPAAFAMPDCAPWDGQAITIVLGPVLTDSVDGTHPQLRVSIYPRGEAVPRQTFRWPADPEVAAGTRCLVSRPCEAATAGEISFRPARADGSLEGRLVLRFGEGDSVYGGFKAEWRPRQVFCG